MLHAFSRTEMLLGKPAMEVLANSRVAVFGIGGVGTFVVEGLVRSGVGKFLLVDDDRICLTNLNRQIHATRKTIGKAKVEVMRDRILEINPKAEVSVMTGFYLTDTRELSVNSPPVDHPLYWEDIKKFHLSSLGPIDYLVDTVDTISAKIDLVVKAQALGIPVISSMGAGNKLDPTRFEVADLFHTHKCPLARILRKELRKLGVTHLKVVYSQEEPRTPLEEEDNSCNTNCVCPSGTSRTCTTRRAIPGSVSFVPSVAGLIIAGEVVKDLIKLPEHTK